MRKRLSELSLRGRRVLFLSNLALSPRQCGKHRQLIDCVCSPRFTFAAEMIYLRRSEPGRGLHPIGPWRTVEEIGKSAGGVAQALETSTHR
jgi:hypothetical protein